MKNFIIWENVSLHKEVPSLEVVWSGQSLGILQIWTPDPNSIHLLTDVCALLFYLFFFASAFIAITQVTHYHQSGIQGSRNMFLKSPNFRFLGLAY